MDRSGWTGKILWVDLTAKKISTVPTTDFEPEKYLGGVGLNTKIFWEMGCPKVDAFDPANPLLISVGPMTGAAGPFNRAEVCGIAPQSYPQETFAYSGVGGKIASEIKYAGYDGLVIVGKSANPVYLSILDDAVKLEEAKFLWGLDTFATQKALRRGILMLPFSPSDRPERICAASRSSLTRPPVPPDRVDTVPSWAPRTSKRLLSKAQVR